MENTHKPSEETTASAPAEPSVQDSGIEVARNPNEETVTLDEPVRRGETVIKAVVIRKPKSGDLRGVKLVDLMQLDVLSLRKVLPRVTVPTLTDIEIGNLDPADLVECGVALTNFLVSKRAKAAACLEA